MDKDRQTGLWEALNSTSKALTKVNSLRSNLRPVTALHSPRALRETGLLMCPPEKSLHNDCIPMPISPFHNVAQTLLLASELVDAR